MCTCAFNVKGIATQVMTRRATLRTLIMAGALCATEEASVEVEIQIMLAPEKLLANKKNLLSAKTRSWADNKFLLSAKSFMSSSNLVRIAFYTRSISTRTNQYILMSRLLHRFKEFTLESRNYVF